MDRLKNTPEALFGRQIVGCVHWEEYLGIYLWVFAFGVCRSKWFYRLDNSGFSSSQIIESVLIFNSLIIFDFYIYIFLFLFSYIHFSYVPVLFYYREGENPERKKGAQIITISKKKSDKPLGIENTSGKKRIFMVLA